MPTRERRPRPAHELVDLWPWTIDHELQRVRHHQFGYNHDRQVSDCLNLSVLDQHDRANQSRQRYDRNGRPEPSEGSEHRNHALGHTGRIAGDLEIEARRGHVDPEPACQPEGDDRADDHHDDPTRIGLELDPQGLPGAGVGETHLVEGASNLPVERPWVDQHPALRGMLVSLIGALVTGIVVIGVGLWLTDSLLSGPVGRWDEGVNDWFLVHRTAGWNEVAHVGSLIAMTGSVIVVAAVSSIALWLMHRRRAVAFLIVALSVEVSVFLVTTLVVERDRPSVPQLEPSPPTSSFPSGHTAAALTLYVGLALLITPSLRHRWMQACMWVLAFAIPLFVAISRVYEGMHHATDVAGSILLALGALTTALIAVRPSMDQGP
jgi:undecaprenyl-diphosphatase